MGDYQQPIDSLKDIKQMMERSSRFISLSGWSGVAAGVCALVGAWFANDIITKNGGPAGEHISVYRADHSDNSLLDLQVFMGSKLFMIAALTFAAAFFLSFFFTWTRSKKTGTPVWGSSSQRLLINVLGPMIAGGLFLLRIIQLGIVGLIAPSCLLFYGLALVNASKYTLGEVRYLGYINILLGIINCWYIGYGLYFWATGFGVSHIIYGIVMWYKYERQ
ncbi:MAG: hypothetical protein HYX40_08405 [Sphingobacteriales bacterium]|nr:hypothetical protein [Sphingobacteriales bacterium]